MKMEEENVKAGVHLNSKKIKIMTTENIYSFNITNEDIKIVPDVA